jgi:RNA polymerase sigma-70 factor (ECF subfamily)
MEMIEQHFSMYSQPLLDKATKIAYRLSLNIESAEDAFQEAFIKFYHSFGMENQTLKTELIFRWLVTVVKNYLLNVKKKQARVTISLDSEQGSFFEPTIEDSEQSKEIAEETRQIQKWIADLDPSKSAIIHLRIYEKRSIQEIAAILNIPEGTVKSRLNRAIASLKKEAQKKAGVVA